MSFLRSFLNIISGLLIIVLPFIFLYWVLDSINLGAIDWVTNALGYIFSPLVEFLRQIPVLKALPNMEFEGLSVDIVPLALFGLVFALSIILSWTSQILKHVENALQSVKSKATLVTKQQIAQREERKQEAETLSHSTAYVVIHINYATTSSAYLVSSGLSKEAIIEMYEKIIGEYKKLNANLIRDSKDSSYKLVFDDVCEAVDYTMQVLQSSVKLSSQLGQSGMKSFTNIGIHSVKPGSQGAFAIAQKVCNLAGENEVVCSKIVRDVHQLSKKNNPLNFFSKGMYTLVQEMELFLIKG